jgi:hypothetical protein
MTGREREALERKARSLLVKIEGFRDDLAEAGDFDSLGLSITNVDVRLLDAAVGLGALLQGPLHPGALSRQRYGGGS